jgi:hypothetical protein
MDDLDRRIKDWGARYPAQGPRESLYERIAASLRSRVAPNVQAQLYAARRQLFWTRAALACCVVLVALLVRPAAGPQVAVAPQVAWPRARLMLASGELQEMREVAEAIEATFPEGVRWIRRTEGALEIETGQPAAVGGGAQRLLISFHLVRRNPDGTETITRRDLIVRDGEPLAWDGARKGALWTHQVSEDYINVDLDGNFGDEQLAIEIRDRLVQPFGEPTRIGRAASQERRYSVDQTVYPL